jgi:tRNA dimethylallyltransferase
MKVSTRQYAKRQVKWIKSKLLPAVRKLEEEGEVTVVLLDASGAFSPFLLFFSSMVPY